MNKDRIDRLIKTLKLDELSELEKESITRVISKYPYQFHLPGDKLGKTSVLTHKINTTDDKPINVKQYR